MISAGRIIPPALFFYARLSACATIFIRLRIFLLDVYPFAHIIPLTPPLHRPGDLAKRPAKLASLMRRPE